MRTIFITGGAGFIGSHLVHRLAKDNKVVIYDTFSRDSLTRLGFDTDPNVTIIKGDILDMKHLAESMKGADDVIHAAAFVGVNDVNNDRLKTMRINIFGTHNVLEAAQNNAIQGRVVTFSTSEIFGPHADKVSESAPVISGPPGEARWGYGISKVAGEHLANAYNKKYGLKTVNVRPFNIYGPGQMMEGAMRMFIANALQNKDITLNGDGSHVRAWCFVDDFVDCILRCLEDPAAVGESFNIGNAQTAVSVRELAEKIISLLDSKSKIIFGKPLETEIYLRIPCADKAKEVLGWEAATGLDEGILKTAESVKKEISVEKDMPTPVPA